MRDIRGHLLIVDDNKVNRLLMTRSVELLGHTAKVAENGRVALDMLRSEQFDVLLLDIEMPIMDGFQFLEDFEKFSETVLDKCKIIMLSSSISPKDIDRAASSKFVKKYLNKPLNARYLEAITV